MKNNSVLEHVIFLLTSLVLATSRTTKVTLLMHVTNVLLACVLFQLKACVNLNKSPVYYIIMTTVTIKYYHFCVYIWTSN